MTRELYDLASEEQIQVRGSLPQTQPRLHQMATSFKLFASLMLCVFGVSYTILLASIWFDTQMNMESIIEAYATFETMELVEHTFKYLPWFLGTFGITTTLFLFSSFAERWKRFLAVAVPLLIVGDIGSTWLIRFHDVFGFILYVSGFALSLCFLVLFSLVQYDLWYGKG